MFVCLYINICIWACMCMRVRAQAWMCVFYLLVKSNRGEFVYRLQWTSAYSIPIRPSPRQSFTFPSFIFVHYHTHRNKTIFCSHFLHYFLSQFSSCLLFFLGQCFLTTYFLLIINRSCGWICLLFKTSGKKPPSKVEVTSVKSNHNRITLDIKLDILERLDVQLELNLLKH